MSAQLARWRDWLGDLIEPFQPADGPPPNTLGAFFRWALKGAWPVLFVAAGFSALAGAMEAVTAFLLRRASSPRIWG